MGDGEGTASKAFPSHLGPYEILGPLGEGGMGKVYKARDTRLGRSVALKVLPPHLYDDPQLRARFEQEAKAASALNHPNIVSIYDIGREGGLMYIVSELIEGETLRELILRGPVPMRKCIAIATEVADAMATAHSAGVVHRDLKPENIMLTRQGRVKVLDFGLAKQIRVATIESASAETQMMTEPGIIMGTSGYMSPEQIRMQTIDHHSDIFSFGTVLYEMISGKQPFAAKSPVEAMYKITNFDPPDLPEDVPKSLAQLVRRCLEKEPANRFQSAADLSYALQMVGEAAAQVTPIANSGVAKPARNWTWAAVAVLLVALAVGGLAYWSSTHQTVIETASTGPELTKGTSGKGNSGGEAKNTGKETGGTENSTDRAGEHEQPKAVPVKVVGTIEATGKTKSTERVEKQAGITTTPPATNSVIETFAGKEWKFSGDGRPATQVTLGHVNGVLADRSGNIYATDSGNHAIVKIDPSGILHVLAGPDSVPQNRPFFPFGLALDASGAIYFGENGQRVRKLSPSGDVFEIAGSDRDGFSPDGSRALGAPLSNVHGVAFAPDGSLVFSEWRNNRVRRVDAQGRLQTVAGNGQGQFGGDGGPAIQASLLHPSQIVYDKAGNLFIADQNNNRVRKVGTDGRITTIAGPLGCPTGVAINSKDDIFIADPCRRRIFMVRSGRVTAFAGVGTRRNEPSGDGGPATAASFDQWGLAMDDRDNLIVAGPDYGNIYRIGSDQKFSIIAGTGNWRSTPDGTKARDAVFQNPLGIAIDKAGAYILSDVNGAKIYRIDRQGIVSTIAGVRRPESSGENVVAKESSVNRPSGIAVRPDGTIAFAESAGNRIRQITPDGVLRTLAGNGKADYSGDGGPAVAASMNNPIGVCLDASGNLYFADFNNHRVRRVAPDGTIHLIAGNGTRGFSGDGGPAEMAALNFPSGVLVGPDSSVYIADSSNHRVRKVANGTITTVVDDGLVSANQLAFGPDGALYIVDTQAARIRRFDLKSRILTTLAGNGDRAYSGDGRSPLEAGLGDPRGLVFDAAGNLYVTDFRTGLVRVIRSK